MRKIVIVVDESAQDWDIDSLLDAIDQSDVTESVFTVGF